MPKILAMDADTVREYDKDGHLHILRSHILKEGIFPYYGREIPRSQELGLDPNKLYRMYRPWSEIEKAADTFARKPILSKHLPINSKMIPKELIVGTIGSDVQLARPYLDYDTSFWTDEAIAGIESKTVQEFSCAYHYVADMTKGEFEGAPFDGIMTELEGNHMAQVEAGRNGSDVLAADSKPENSKMKMTKLGKALFVTLGGQFPKLAQDAKLGELCSKVTRKNHNRDAFRTAVIAMDADIDAGQLDNVVDAMVDVDNPDPVEPQDKATKLKSLLAGYGLTEEQVAAIMGIACDDAVAPAAPEGGMPKPGSVPPAMDSAAVQKLVDSAVAKVKQDNKEANEAKALVKPVVGDVLAMDSAADVYRFALDHMKVDHAGVDSVSALRSIFNATNKVAPVIAQDAKLLDNSIQKRIPNVARFSAR